MDFLEWKENRLDKVWKSALTGHEREIVNLMELCYKAGYSDALYDFVQTMKGNEKNAF